MLQEAITFEKEKLAVLLGFPVVDISMECTMVVAARRMRALMGTKALLQVGLFGGKVSG